jgi:type IV pilus assembly protein PilW
MKSPHRSVSASPRSTGQAGFSLVEILVGVAIAMIGVAIMMEVLLTSDQRTRTTTTGNDALSTGAVMMHLMQRDLLQAGYGINSTNLLGCNLVLPTTGTDAIQLAPYTINSPVIPAGDPNTDTLLIFYGSDNGEPEGQAVISTAGSGYMVKTPSAFTQNDFVLAWPGSCSGNLRLSTVTGFSAGTVNVSALNASATVIYNLGRAPRVVAYAVRNGALTSCDFMVADCRVNNSANWTAVAANIVSLRIQYGRDTAGPGAMDAGADVWDQATPSDPGQTARACAWNRVPALRFVLVARSDRYETQIDPTTKQRVCEPVTPTARTWAGSATTPIDLSAVPGLTSATEWQCYRYKTFESVAPSRNIVWMRPQASC